MQITVEIPESKASFVMELFKSIPFIKIKPQADSFTDFREEWKALSARLPQTEPDISDEEIMDEIRAVRREKKRRNDSVAE